MKSHNDRSRAAWALRERGFSYGSITKEQNDERAHSLSTIGGEGQAERPDQIGGEGAAVAFVRGEGSNSASTSSTDPTIHSSNNPIIRLSIDPSIHLSMLARREAELRAAIGHDWREP
jgi:hypothetical protein